MRVLITGGARSGKSVFAEQRAGTHPTVTYVATGPTPGPQDPDWAARVAAHRRRRPAAWGLVETTDLAGLLASPPPGVLLVDCLTLWLAAACDAAQLWGPEPRPDELAAATSQLLTAWRDCAADVVLVTNEVGSGVHPATPAGRVFRDEMGRLNIGLAGCAEEVWLVTVGIPVRLR